MIIEYTPKLEQKIKDSKLMQELHKTAIEKGAFAAGAIKTRLRRTDDYIIGEKNENAGDFIYVMFSWLEGRTLEQKVSLSESLQRVLLSHFPELDSASVEIRDMGKETYSKN